MHRLPRTALMGLFLLLCGVVHATPLNHIVAVVNQNIITAHELDQYFEQQRREDPHLARDLKDDPTYRKQLLESLIVARLEEQQAAHEHLAVSDAELDQWVTRVAQERSLSLEALQQMVASHGMSWETYRDALRLEGLRNKLYERHVYPKIQISEEEVAQFLSSLKGQQSLNTEYQVRHLLLAVPKNPTTTDLTRAEAQALDLRDQTRKGVPFETLVIQHSQSSTAARGGDLGWRSLQQLPSLFATSLVHLRRGEVAGPLKNSSGYHLIQLTDKRPMPLAARLQLSGIFLPSLESTPEEREHFKDAAKALKAGHTSLEAVQAQHPWPLPFAGWQSMEQLPDAARQAVNEQPVGTWTPLIEDTGYWYALRLDDRQAPPSEEERARALLAEQKFGAMQLHFQQQLLRDAYLVRYL